MKLSFLGMEKLMAWASNDIKGDLKDLEFEQKDFKGSVLLTVEEANLLFKVIEDLLDLKPPTTKEICYVSKLKARVERVAKAEKCDA